MALFRNMFSGLRDAVKEITQHLPAVIKAEPIVHQPSKTPFHESVFNGLRSLVREITQPSPVVIQSRPIVYQTSETPFWGTIGQPRSVIPVTMQNESSIEARQVRKFPIPLYELFSTFRKCGHEIGQEYGIEGHLYLAPDGQLTNYTDNRTPYQQFFTLQQAEQIIAAETIRREKDRLGLVAEITEFVMPYDFRSKQPDAEPKTVRPTELKTTRPASDGKQGASAPSGPAPD